MLQRSSLICQNEAKLIFEPYDKDQLSEILCDIYQKHMKQMGKIGQVLLEKEIVQERSFQLAAGKIDKISGDIRVCFEILR